MHSIIDEFINTSDRLGVILERNHDKSQYLEVVFYQISLLSNSFEEVEEKVYLDIDKAIIHGHSDPDVYMLFLSFAISFTCRREKFKNAWAIQSIGMSLFSEEIEPVLQSYFILSIATLKFMEYNSSECYDLLKKSLNLIDKKSPRYPAILINVSNLLAYTGRLNELGKEDLALLDLPNSRQHALVAIQAKLTNETFLCNYQGVFALLEELKNKFQGNDNFLIAGTQEILEIMSGNFDEKNYHDQGYKHFANACNFLLLGNIEKAGNSFRMYQESDWKTLKKISLEKYLPLHFALGLKNKGKTRLLLNELEKKGDLNYLDDFFLARVQLLEMNKPEAYKTFSRLIKNVNQFGAINRLEFEMQFAKELRTIDILFLMNGVQGETSKKEGVIEIKKPVISSKQGKGVKLLIGESEKIVHVKILIKKFSNLFEPILVTGETGTGKELVARAIHEEGPNTKEPFLAINCGALTDSLLQSELFGYVAGAFTGAQKEHKGIFEAAGKGTVFLDEFGDISPKLQASLLRVLESNEIRLIGGTSNRQIECKVVIATNIDLQKAVEEKRFREDLYFRLTRFDIKLSPLRERIEDIPLLIDYFLKNSKTATATAMKFSHKLIDALTKYRWPGNIRELKNEIERIKILHSEKEILDIDDFDMAHLWGTKSINVKNENTITENEMLTYNLFKPNAINNNHIFNIIHKGSKVNQRLEIIKELFKQYKKLTRRQIMEILNVSAGTATSDLKTLCDAGFVERISPSKSQKSDYFLLLSKF